MKHYNIEFKYADSLSNMDNMEVISHGTMIDGNISTLEVILGKNES